MKYKLTHVGLACEDIEKQLEFYTKQLGHQCVGRLKNEELFDVAYVGIESDVILELSRCPVIPDEAKYVPKRSSINSISFLVEDVGAAFEELTAKGVTVAYPVKDGLFTRECGFLDPDGLLFKVYSYSGVIRFVTATPASSRSNDDIAFHHVSMITNDLKRSVDFYSRVLNLKKVYQYPVNPEVQGGFVFLKDNFYELNSHHFLFEIIGPPVEEECARLGLEKCELEPREIEMLKKVGRPCYDHLAYTSLDAGASWRKAINRGAKNYMEPIIDYGKTIGWCYDAEGNDIEFLTQLRDEFENVMLRGGLVSIDHEGKIIELQD